MSIWRRTSYSGFALLVCAGTIFASGVPAHADGSPGLVNGTESMNTWWPAAELTVPVQYVGPPFFFGVPTLKELSSRDNRAEGRALKKMQYDPACRMAVSTPTVTDFPGSGVQRFVVVPMVLENSTHICTPMNTSGTPLAS